MKINRYKLRPGITNIPTSLPMNEEEVLSLDGSVILKVDTESVYNNDNDFDLDYFVVLDKDLDEPYLPFYEWLAGSRVRGMYQHQIIEKYNEVMDNVNWLIRNKSLEEDITYINDVDDKNPPMTLYEMNQQAYDKIAPKNTDEMEQVKKDLCNFIDTYLDGLHAMLLCKELSDYTIFYKKDSIDIQDSVDIIIDLLKTRGPILDCHFNKDGKYMECWVRYREDSTPHMYVLFNADGFVVKY